MSPPGPITAADPVGAVYLQSVTRYRARLPSLPGTPRLRGAGCGAAERGTGRSGGEGPCPKAMAGLGPPACTQPRGAAPSRLAGVGGRTMAAPQPVRRHRPCPCCRRTVQSEPAPLCHAGGHGSWGRPAPRSRCQEGPSHSHRLWQAMPTLGGATSPQPSPADRE